MIHRGCVKGFIFPDRQDVAEVAEEGNGYFCQTCGKPLTGSRRKYCSKACGQKKYYESHKDNWKRYGRGQGRIARQARR